MKLLSNLKNYLDLIVVIFMSKIQKNFQLILLKTLIGLHIKMKAKLKFRIVKEMIKLMKIIPSGWHYWKIHFLAVDFAIQKVFTSLPTLIKEFQVNYLAKTRSLTLSMFLVSGLKLLVGLQQAFYFLLWLSHAACAAQLRKIQITSARVIMPCRTKFI